MKSARKIIHVACSIDFTKSDEYIVYLAILLKSILENTSAQLVFHVFYMGEVPLSMEKIRHMVEQGNRAELELHEVCVDDFFFELRHIHLWSPAIVFKFYFPTVLADISKVIFFDLDIVVKKDIRLLWDIDMTDYSVAGVQYISSDQVNKEFNSYEEEHSLASRINGGLVVMNLDRIRSQHHLLDEIRSFIHAYPDIKGIDEIAFNHFFYQDTLKLPHSMEHFLGLDGLLFDEEDASVRCETFCMHYAHESKPFHFVNGEPDYWFWKYYQMTPFHDERTLLAYFHRVGLQKSRLLSERQNIRGFFEDAYRRPLICFGTGVFAKKLVKHLQEKGFQISCLTSNKEDEWGMTEPQTGLPIHALQESLKKVRGGDAVCLIAILNERNNEEVKRQLINCGLKLGKDFFEGKILFGDLGKG